jgi:trans-aconitate methyltransferase
MRDENMIVRDRQHGIRREMDRRSIALKQVQYDGGWQTVSTIASYFPLDNKEPATMSVAALHRLIRTNALPLDLLSLLLPEGFQIVRLPEDVDHDEYETMTRDYLAAKWRAHHPASPGGREITDEEKDGLNQKAARLQVRA